MPVATVSSSPLAFEFFDEARAVPAPAIDALSRDGVQGNPILPFLLKCRSLRRTESGNYWAVVYSNQEKSSVLYVASCTKNALGDYPLFIFTTIPYHLLPRDVTADMRFLCTELDKSALARERIYSVFAFDLIAQAFAREWTRVTGIECYSTPFYDCKGSFCTQGDLKALRQKTILSDQGIDSELAPANKSDIAEIGRLCEGFSGESQPFLLTPSQGLEEATKMVENNLVWVYRIRKGPSAKWEIACIAAFTRNTDKVATITKVYTHPDWRRYGCAARLTRRVCDEMFKNGKEKVALFVGNDNPASFVYDKVGFLGLAKEGPRVEGVHRWLELAFDKRKVRQGHW